MPASEHYPRKHASRLPGGERTLVDVYMPAMWPLGLSRAVANWIRAWRRRRAFLRLLKLDDRMLRDLGYTREDVLRAARLPWRENAAQAVLERGRRARSWPGHCTGVAATDSGKDLDCGVRQHPYS